MVESEEVSLQTMAEAIGSEEIITQFGRMGAKRANSLGRVDFCPGAFSVGTVSIPVLADLRGQLGL